MSFQHILKDPNMLMLDGFYTFMNYRARFHRTASLSRAEFIRLLDIPIWRIARALL